MPLNCLKQVLPLETSKFATSREIDDGTMFKQWVPCTLIYRDHIVAGVKSRMGKFTHEHSVEFTTSKDEGAKLNEKNDNALQMDVTSRETENLKVAFHMLEDRVKIPVDYDKASGHLVFDT